MTSENETVEDIVQEMRDIFALTGIDKNKSHLMGFFERIEMSHRREIAELRECLKETMVDAAAEYKNNSCFRNVKCGEIERCGTCKVMKWRKAIERSE